MSEAFEAPTPHEHAAEHAAESDPKGMAGKLAVMTAIIATIGALVSNMAGSSEVDALLLKNEASIKKTEAANQWAYYQSKGQKKNLSELGAQLVGPDRKPFFDVEAKRYAADQDKIKLTAEALEKASTELEHRSEGRIHQHHRWAQAQTVLQISIALAAIALLTRRRWLAKVVYAVSAAGVAVGILAWMHI